MADTSHIVSDEFLTAVLGDVLHRLPENEKRILVASMAIAIGYGGVTRINRLSGISRVTIHEGIRELLNPERSSKNIPGAQTEDVPVRKQAKGIRKPGAGRKKTTEKYPGLADRIEQIISDSTFGDPERTLCWTSFSLNKIREELADNHGVNVSHTNISLIMDTLGYSKQLNQKMLQVGKPHPDRDAQFRYINEASKAFLEAGDPVISVDCKKKENIGNFKNNGAEFRKAKNPRKVLDHDFPIKELGKVAPYGVYVLNDNTGFINLGLNHDTAEFAVHGIRGWWHAVGKNTFPNAKRLMVTCDGGGSNGSRNRLWKREIALLAEETGLEIHVSHFPPGTSKWNKVEHRLFCYISKNWQGKPLVDMETIVSLIGSTTTEKGLKVICQVDERYYETGLKVSDDEMGQIRMQKGDPFPSWNYIITGFESALP